MKQVMETLTCELTEAELNEKGQLMSTAMLEYDEKEDAKKEATKEFAEELKRFEAACVSFPRRSGQSANFVRCRARFNFIPRSQA